MNMNNELEFFQKAFLATLGAMLLADRELGSTDLAHFLDDFTKAARPLMEGEKATPESFIREGLARLLNPTVARIEGSGEPLAQAVHAAVARGWCHKKTKHLEMDTDLAHAIAAEVMCAMPHPAPAVGPDKYGVELVLALRNQLTAAATREAALIAERDQLRAALELADEALGEIGKMDHRIDFDLRNRAQRAINAALSAPASVEGV